MIQNLSIAETNDIVTIPGNIVGETGLVDDSIFRILKQAINYTLGKSVID